MNILFSLGQGHPEVVDELMDGSERVSFDRVVEVVESREFPVVLNRDIGEALKAQEPFSNYLVEAYLPVIEAERWGAALEGAKESEERTDLEWVAFAPGRDQSRGITLPDSWDPKAQVSLFSQAAGAVCQLSLNYPTAGEPPSGISLAAPIGCSLPDWGACQDGECGGDCELRRRYGDIEGLVCRCPHSL